MNVSAFDKTTGDFDWNFHAGASTGTGVESGDVVTFNSFGGDGSPDLAANASVVDGAVTLTSVVGACPNNGGTNEWVFTSGGDLVVNSTLDKVDSTEARDGVCNVDPKSTPPVCTLAQAVAVSNVQGGDTIRFDILHKDANVFDGSVPRIDLGEQGLEVNAPTDIDASSQPGGRVELSGEARNNDGGSLTRGLYVAVRGAGSTITGMVINGFNDQIQLVGGDDTIQGDWFMTDARGTAPQWNPSGKSLLRGELAQVGVDIESSGNQIGGTESGEGDVFALSWESPPLGRNTESRGVGAIYDGGLSLGPNVIQGNDIGIRPGSDERLFGPPPRGAPPDFDAEPGLYLSGVQDVGGPSQGEGNRVYGAIFAGGSVVQGNTFFGGVEVTGAATIGGQTPTPGTGPGNVFDTTLETSSIVDELEVFNASVAVQGNLFKGQANEPVGSGVAVRIDGTTIGGSLSTETNDFSDLEAKYGAISLFEGHNEVENDVMSNNSGAGVDVVSGSGSTIAQVSMRGNAQGIELGGNGFLYNPDVPGSTSGPNDAEAYPQITSDQATASSTSVTGSVPQSGVLTIDLYGQETCKSNGFSPGQGGTFIAGQSFISLPGHKTFTLNYPALPAAMGAITMTATATDGSTSEFSPCLSTNASMPTLAGAGVVPTTANIPISPGAAASSIAPRIRSGRVTSRGGHAMIQLLCPGGAESPCSGSASIVILGAKFHHAKLVSATFSMSAGTVAPLKIAVDRTLYAALQKARRIAARLTTVASDASGTHVTKSFTLTITLAK